MIWRGWRRPLFAWIGRDHESLPYNFNYLCIGPLLLRFRQEHRCGYQGLL